MSLTPSLNSNNNLAASFNFLIDILLPCFFICPPFLIKEGSVACAAGRRRNPILPEHRIHSEGKSVRGGVDLPFGHHRIGCSVKIGFGVRGGVDFSEQEKKQVDMIDVQDKLWPIRSKVAFLESIMLPDTADEALKLSHDERIGLGLILRDIHDGIKEITDAEIIGHRASEPIALRKEA
jgi:hypothetical protein